MSTQGLRSGVTHSNPGGTPMAPTQSDDDQLRARAGEGLTEAELAKRLGVPRSTVRDRLKKLGTALPLDVTAGASPARIPRVHHTLLEGMREDLQEIIAWWQERKATLQQASDASRKTERTTFHVAQR